MSQLPNYIKVSSFRGSSGGSSIAGKVLLGASLISGVLSVYSYFQVFEAEREIEFRKSQLKLPVYQLTEQQMVNPPWNHENIDTWLYRREVIGRPIHRLASNIPTTTFNQDGFLTIVPLVTREDNNHKNRHGLLLNMGYIPGKLKSPTCRLKIERVDRQKFICYVGKVAQLSNHSLLQGNAYHTGRQYFTNADIQDMVKSSEFLNKDQASVAVLEQLHETGVLDERSSVRFDVSSQFTQEYPWAKTESGALQLYKMPWDYRNEAKHYFIASLASFIVGASIF